MTSDNNAQVHVCNPLF